MNIFPHFAAWNAANGVAALSRTRDSKSPRALRHRLRLAAALLMTLGTSNAARAADFVVTSTADSGAGSLRQAIADANDAQSSDAITFAGPAFAAPRKTITLASGVLGLSNGTVSITAPSVGVVVSGGGVDRVFVVGPGANATLAGLTISGGSSEGGGGAIANIGGNLLLDSCTLSGNRANNGGAILSQTASGQAMTLRNCTLSGNTATGPDAVGGAVYNFRGLLLIESSTISGNTAPASNGGGVVSAGDAVTRTEVGNSIIAGNTGGDVTLVSGTVNSFQSNGYNLIGSGNLTSGFSGSGDVKGNANPGLAALAENSGRTPTRALLTTSPARDTGRTTLTVDQRGAPRPVGSADDKGAFELAFDLAGAAGLIVTTTADTQLVDGLISLREAIANASIDNQNSTITFDGAAFAAPRKTITLAGTLLEINPNGTLSITAPPAGVVVSGGGASRVFGVNPSILTLSGLTISGGNAGSGGGGGITNNGTLLLDSCTLSGNSAAFGGALFSITDLDGRVMTTLRNCTLSGNTATSEGGAIYNNVGQTNIESSTISGNTAPVGRGGGVVSRGDTATRTSVGNSIIAGNTGDDVTRANSTTNPFASLGFNLIGSGNAAGNFNQTGDATGNINPGLAALAENGGRAQTRALLLTSPARDTGSTTLAVDGRGVSRPQGGTGADDKGAFEFDSPIVISIARASSSPTTASSVVFTVTFSESVTGVDSGDFAVVTTGGISGASVTSVTGSGTTYSVTVSGISGTSGTVGLNLVDDDTIIDAMGNKLGGNGAGNGNFTGQVYTRNVLPSLSINDVSVTEGNGGTTSALFTVTLSSASPLSVEVDFATSDGTALSSSDYGQVTGRLLFAPNETTKTLIVPILGDTSIEPNETFLVNLSGATNATLADASGTGTITNDDSDSTQPTVSISTPANRSFVTRLGSISGTVTDNQGGSGIARVDLLFKRNSDGKYWNGSIWDTTTPVTLATTLQRGTWSKTSELPLTNTLDLSKKLLDGSYLLTATAYDVRGNRKSANNFFTLDKINPAVSITTPVNQSFVTSLQTISGTATDNEGGSGIARLDVFLKRNSDGNYWTGSAWGTTTPVALVAGLNKTAWGITSSNLPSPSAIDINKRLTDDTYLVTATAYDKAGNQKSIGSFFTVDRVNPAVTISTPAHRSVVRSLSSVSGTALDNAGGSGILRVDLFLKRNLDGKYWNGSAWDTTTPVALTVGLGNGNWGRTSSGLPSNSTRDLSKRLTPGDYTLVATAFDRANNQKSTSNLFSVTSSGIAESETSASRIDPSAPEL